MGVQQVFAKVTRGGCWATISLEVGIEKSLNAGLLGRTYLVCLLHV